SSPSPAITTAPVVKIKEHTESKPDMKSFVSKDGEKVPLYKALRHCMEMKFAEALYEIDQQILATDAE
ncbi:hypothetical protein ONR49_26490, partial [Salmonella enterica subsp. enterica serovar Virginia]|nr:hypothetical protein [Salmonella enterica subsp. enterica serovar Virginia]